MAGLSPALPLTVDPTDGYFRLTKTILQVTRQNLKNLVLTCPGERVMDLSFGVGLRNYLFQQNVPITYEKISARIIEQSKIYMPHISIDDVLFGVNDANINPMESNTLSISVQYTITALNVKDVLQLPDSSDSTQGTL